MKSKDRPQGIYLSTANSIPVLKALDELNLLGTVQIVTTDLFQELVPLIEFGKVLATMYQRPYTQGKVAFESLVEYLRSDDKVQPAVRLAPHVIFRSNLSLFAGQIVDTDEEIEPELRRR
jgi:LacI family transcriptional regulator